jgi:hypothetical protein
MEIDGAEGSVLPKVRRAIDEQILAAKLLFDVAEAVSDVFDADWDRRRWPPVASEMALRTSSPLSLLGLMLVLMA